MINVSVKRLLGEDRLIFDVDVVDEDTGGLTLQVRGCSIFKGHLNGPAVKIGIRWAPVVSFDGGLKDAILKALEPFKAQYAAVQWPKE